MTRNERAVISILVALTVCLITSLVMIEIFPTTTVKLVQAVTGPARQPSGHYECMPKDAHHRLCFWIGEPLTDGRYIVSEHN